MGGFANAFKSFGVGRMMVMLGVAIGVAATLAFTVFNVGATPKALLYSNLDLKEAGDDHRGPRPGRRQVRGQGRRLDDHGRRATRSPRPA